MSKNNKHFILVNRFLQNEKHQSINARIGQQMEHLENIFILPNHKQIPSLFWTETMDAIGMRRRK